MDSIAHNSIRRRELGRLIPSKSVGHLSWLFFALIMVLFGTLLQLSFTMLNPDWLSYQYIYDSQGGWLNEQGRDPAFLLLTSHLSNLFGPQGYEAYRILLALYFLLFVALLSSGCIFKLNLSKSGYIFLMIALVYLGFTRFTIQIREGLAITLVILSLAHVLKRSYGQEQAFLRSSGNSRSMGLLHMGGAWSFLIVAGLTHAATLSVLPILLAAVWITRQGRTGNHKPLRPVVQTWRLRLLWVAAFFLAGLAVAQLYLGGPLERAAAEIAGDRLVEVKVLSMAQLGLWGLYGGACWLVFREVRASVKQRQIIGTFASFLQILSGPVIAATYVSIVLALTLAVAPLLVTGYVRLLHMFLALALLCLAVTGRRRWPMLIVGIFLIADQVRSIIDSISIYFGVNLL